MVGTISVYLVGGDAPFFPASGLCVRLVIRESVVEKKKRSYHSRDTRRVWLWLRSKGRAALQCRTRFLVHRARRDMMLISSDCCGAVSNETRTPHPSFPPPSMTRAIQYVKQSCSDMIASLHSASRRRKRPVESTLPIHVLSRLHLLILPHAVIRIVARHLRVLGALEPREAHDLRHLPRVVVHALWPRPLRLLLHLHVLVGSGTTIGASARASRWIEVALGA